VPEGNLLEYQIIGQKEPLNWGFFDDKKTFQKSRVSPLAGKTAVCRPADLQLLI